MKSGKDGLGYQKGLQGQSGLNTLQRPVNIKLLNCFISDFHPFHPGIEREQRNLSHKMNEVLKKISEWHWKRGFVPVYRRPHVVK